jgi:hypothetical protein
MAVCALYYRRRLANCTPLTGYGGDVDSFIFLVVGVFQRMEREIEK